MRANVLPRLTPRLLTTNEAASLLNVSSRTILNWIKADAIPYVEMPSAGVRVEYRIPEIALLRSLSGNYDLVAELQSLDEAAEAAGLSEDEVTTLVLGHSQ